MRAVLGVMILTAVFLEPVSANPYACKSSIEELSPRAELIVLARIENSQLVESSSTDNNPVDYMIRLRVGVLEYLHGDGPDTLEVEYRPHIFVSCPDAFNLSLGEEVVLFIGPSGDRLHVVNEESGILSSGNLSDARLASVLKDFDLGIEIESKKSRVGRQYIVTHRLLNIGNSPIEGCTTAAAAWEFSDSTATHIASSHYRHTFWEPRSKCKRRIELQPGESTSWSRQVGMPSAIQYGEVTVVARIQFLQRPDCRDSGCGRAILRSKPASFSFEPGPANTLDPGFRSPSQD